MAWLGTWAHRIEITVDADLIDANLSDFPLALILDSSAGITAQDVTAIFTELGSDANRKKIAVTQADGTTQCYVEIELWDHAGSKAVLHVRAPSISSATDTTLYIYYDSAEDDNTTYVGDTGAAVAQNVWDSGFRVVSHLADDSLLDSTANSNNGSNGGTVDMSGIAASGRDFELGDSDWIGFGDVEDINGVSITASIVFKFESFPASSMRLCQKRGTGAAGSHPGWQLSTYYVGGTTSWSNCQIDGGNGHYVKPGLGYSNGIETGIFHYVALSFDTATGIASLYIDGVLIDAQANTNLIGANISNGRQLTLGCAEDAGSRSQYFDGILDEFRFSNQLRSAAWIKATYHTLFDTLLTFGSEEDIPGVVNVDLNAIPLGLSLGAISVGIEVPVFLNAIQFGINLGALTVQEGAEMIGRYLIITARGIAPIIEGEAVAPQITGTGKPVNVGGQ